MVNEKITTESEYAQIRTQQVEIVNKCDLILHIIHTATLEIVNTLKTTIVKSIQTNSNKDLAFLQSESIRNTVKNPIPHRSKRGLINLGGSVVHWVFGAMDNDDQQNILIFS
ncbi:unnamed protein product [Hermetia illucens]|uniref:Uncharacterized protein n=1 Tax=Hermetia illucens TaxID=343691 RepID=A0A7R8UQY1_HERIL|nr:unnamed protein product [Hermetia illucens]